MQRQGKLLVSLLMTKSFGINFAEDDYNSSFISKNIKKLKLELKQ